MTQNQIAWAKVQEEKRHNVISEGETGRHNLAEEQIRYQSNSIQKEMNTINSHHYVRMDRENQRHNRAEERISNKQIAESRRHSKESEEISWFQSQEQRRHNVATEGVDWANVGVGRMNAAANQMGAEASMSNALSNMMNANTRTQELDLARDKYSLDQSTTMAELPGRLGKIEAEKDLAKRKVEYQELQNQYYLWDKASDIFNQLGPISPAGDAPVGKTPGRKQRQTQKKRSK